jgi:hypothetical protein
MTMRNLTARAGRGLVAALLMAGLGAPAMAAEPAGPLDVTCGDLLLTLRDADPGKNPSKARKQRAVEAQDDVAIGLYWIHGYLVGTKGAAAPQLTRAWMESEIVRLVGLCQTKSPDGQMSLVQVMQ